MITDQIAAPLEGRALAEYGAERIKNEAFDQIRLLWERRKSEGWTQKQVADAIGRDPAWVSRNLTAPGNWTVRTIGAFVQALNGEIEIKVSGLDDAVEVSENFDAYAEYASVDVRSQNLFQVQLRETVKPFQLQSSASLGD